MLAGTRGAKVKLGLARGKKLYDKRDSSSPLLSSSSWFPFGPRREARRFRSTSENYGGRHALLAEQRPVLDDHRGPADGGGVRIESRFTQEEIEQMIGVSRESANRLISSFAGRGWIDWNVVATPSC